MKINEMVRVETLCCHCSHEYEVEIDSLGLYNFGDCPKCGERNDRWIKLTLKQEANND